METSVFTNKSETPDDKMLETATGILFPLWKEIRNYVLQAYPLAIEEWNFPGAKYGWSFRIKDKKRAIIYLLPREGYFLVALVFGEKATHAALGSGISDEIKTIIGSARVYAEGRGFRIEVRNHSLISDIKQLIDIKLNF
jgi:hypothetical protein